MKFTLLYPRGSSFGRWQVEEFVVGERVEVSAQAWGTVDAQVDDDPVEPGAELGVPAKLWQAHPGTNEGVLSSISSIFGIAQAAQGQVIDEALMQLYQRCKSFHITSFGLADEIGFGHARTIILHKLDREGVKLFRFTKI
jgi:hypothetical protein